MLTRRPPSTRLRHRAGYALVLVVGFTAVSLMTLAALMQWSSTNSKLIERNNQYSIAQAAAEAATEKVLSQMSADFQNDGEVALWANLANYQQLVPTPGESGAWDGFEFTDAGGSQRRTHVHRIYSNTYTNLESQYPGLMCMASGYRVVANARDTSRYGIYGAVGQEVQAATVPIFQFAMFYNLDMEISCGQPFNVTGRVHSNGQLYIQPDSTLTFQSAVTAVGNITWGRAPGDGRGGPGGSVNYRGAKDSKVSALTLPIGTNNSSTAVQSILEVPPATEPLTSPMGRERLYNKADLVIVVTNNSIRVLSGPNAPTPLSPLSVTPTVVAATVKTNASFKDHREGKTVWPIDLDVAAITNFTRVIDATSSLRSSAAGAGYVVYIDDRRRLASGVLNAVRLTNGAVLPDTGITFATARPLYVQGHYNAPTSTERGSTNTIRTEPSALMADAITVLSTAWTDANSTAGMPNRKAADTTVNAAFLSGIIETKTANSYSGGVENFPRFLEDWSPDGVKKTFTYNGSMVVMFNSRYATNRWGMGNVYDAPGRNWSFDRNFTDVTKLPPATPQFRTLKRSKWQILAPGTTNMVSSL